jgi:hypothetical protein
MAKEVEYFTTKLIRNQHRRGLTDPNMPEIVLVFILSEGKLITV